MPATIKLVDVYKGFSGTPIIKGVSLTVAASEFLVMVGPSGCGKSTLLRMIAGLEGLSSGDIYFGDDLVNDWDAARRRVGMVFQSYALYPHMTVEENIGFGLKLARKSRTERSERVDEALRVLQLEHLRGHKPSQLSGGQRQRVAIGRAIVRNPNVFLFDEPLSNLDASLRVQMRMEIGRLHQRLKNTVIYVTHDQAEAMTLADRIVVLNEGQIRQIGIPMELYERPANLFVAGFIGTPTMAFLPVEGRLLDSCPAIIITGSDGLERPIPLPMPLPASVIGQSLTLGIRPENCNVCEGSASFLKGKVVLIERLGADTFAFLDLPGVKEPVAVRLAEKDRGITPGLTVGFGFDPARALLFDSIGDAVANPVHTKSDGGSYPK